jgi:hypothetical protein
MMKKIVCVSLTILLLTNCEKKGLDGNNSLVRIDIEPIGANCTAGGYLISNGLDVNKNNILDPEEVQTSNYICNGTDGDPGNDGIDGLNSLIQINSEPYGDICSNGGYRINSGIDINRNDTLDADEIQITEYICHGDDGGYDKVTFLPFIRTTGSFSSSTIGSIPGLDVLPGFHIANYLDADSVVFGTFMGTSNPQSECIVELFDNTNYKAIKNTRLITNSTSTWNTTTVNFINDLPNEVIDLRIYIKSGMNGTNVHSLDPALIIYRK